MNLTDLLALALRNLRQAKLRTALTVMGVVVGVAAIITMVSFGLGLQNNIITQALARLEIFTTITVTGVNVDALQVLPDHRTASYMALHGPAGELSFAVNDMRILEALSPTLLQTHQQWLQLADCVVLDCNLSSPSLAWLLQPVTTRDALPPIFVDGVSVAKCTRLMPHLAHIHTLKVNRLEAQALTGQALGCVDDALRASRQLHDLGVRNVVLSLGKDGACWCDDLGQVGHSPSGNVQIVNTNGAGDAMTAGLVHAYLLGLPLREAVDWASACAQITLASVQANAPTLSPAAVQSHLRLETETK